MDVLVGMLNVVSGVFCFIDDGWLLCWLLCVYCFSFISFVSVG